MRGTEQVIKHIREAFQPFEKDFLSRQDNLWELFNTALDTKYADQEAKLESIDNAKKFLNVLFTADNPSQIIEHIIINHIRGKRSIFQFIDETDLFLNSVCEYISTLVPFKERTKLLKVIFKLKELIENIAWQTKMVPNTENEIVTFEFLQPLQHHIENLLKEVYLWVSPIMVSFFVASQKGEMKSLALVGRSKDIFEDITIRVSMSTKWGQGPVAEAFRSEKVIYVCNRSDVKLEPFLHLWEQQGINSAVLLPVIRGHYKFGVLALTFPHEIKEEYDIEDELAPFLDKLANLIIINFKKSEENVYRTLILDNYEKSFQAIVSLLEKKDKYTAFHSQLVTSYANIIANYLGIPQFEQGILNIGSILHDIGKVGILDSILLKQGRLNSNEWEIMKRHPEFGYQIIDHMDVQHDVSEIILYHHERWDGKGYPFGINAEKIPYLARIVTVADALEAITSRRPYRDAHDFDFAKKEILLNSGTQFDPCLIEKFINIPNEEFITNKINITSNANINISSNDIS